MSIALNLIPWIEGILPKGPYLPCLCMADRALLAGYPRDVIWVSVIRTVYPKKYAHGFVVLCFVVVMQSFIMNSHEVFIHIHQGYFAGTGAIVRLPQYQWSKPDGYGKISQCITTTKHSKAVTVCIFLGIYCMWEDHQPGFSQWWKWQVIYPVVILWPQYSQTRILHPKQYRQASNIRCT